MDIDFQGARGSFSFAPKGKPGPEGIHGNLKISVKVEINVPVDFLDKYMDGHLTGAQPSSVLWKELDPGNPSTDVVPRYMFLKRIDLEVSEDRRYGFRIKSPPPELWEGDWTGAQIALLPCQLKKASISPATNGAVAAFTFVLEHQQSSILRDLGELVVLEEVVVDGWLVDRDLAFGPDGDEDDDQDEDGDPDAENEAADATEEAPE